MAGLTPQQLAALQPLRAALVTRAAEQAAEQVCSAERDARAARAEAVSRAEAELAEARTAGRADAAAELLSERAQRRRAAREMVLEAQGAVYRELRQEAVEAVARLLADPVRFDGLVTRLRGELGKDASVRPAAGGGVVVDASDGRRVDASVQSLVDAAAAALDQDRP